MMHLVDCVVECDFEGLLALLSRGADVNGADPDGATALMAALNLNYQGFALYLLERGADPNLSDESGETPLAAAIPFDSGEVVRALIDRGADIHQRHEGRSYLDLAYEHGAADACVCLRRAGLKVGTSVLAAVDRRARFWMGWGCAAVQAARTGDREMVARCLAHGVDPEALDRREPLLAVAAAEGHVGVIEELVRGGSRVDVRVRAEGATPLMQAARGRKPEAARALLALGADVNARTRNGTTPLIAAAQAGCVETARLLVDAGADTEARDDAGGRMRSSGDRIGHRC